jgi:hypothetical protein
MIAPADQLTHTGHKLETTFSGSSMMPSHIEDDRKVMGYASHSSSSQAKGISALHDLPCTKQAIANAKRKDTIMHSSSVTNQDLSSLDDAEGVRDLLLQYQSKVLILKMKMDERCAAKHTSIEVENELSTISNNYEVDTNVTEVQGSLGTEKSSVIHNIAADWIRKEKNSPKSKVRNDLLCIAWMTLDMAKLLSAYCYSLCIDATHKTVKVDGLCLLTVTARDSFGRTVVVLRIWIPNQQKWIFRYVLFTVIPNMIGKQYCTRVNTFCTDGDPQMISIIDESMRFLYTRAVRRRCGWHIVQPPLVKYRRLIACKKGVTLYFVEWFFRFIQSWIYTWIRPSGGCYSQEEVLVSKALLISFLTSQEMKSKFSDDSIGHLKDYVIDVIGNEKDVAFYNFLDVFDLEVYSNSSHEGTNNSIKHNSEPVLPTMSLGMSTNTIARHDKLVFIDRNKQCNDEFKKQKNWTEQWASLTEKSASILTNESKKISMAIASTFVAEESASFVLIQVSFVMSFISLP